MKMEEFYSEEIWVREIEEFLDKRAEIYPLPDRLLFKHLMGCEV